MRKLGLFVLLITTLASAETGLAQSYPAPKEGDWIAKDLRFHTRTGQAGPKAICPSAWYGSGPGMGSEVPSCDGDTGWQSRDLEKFKLLKEQRLIYRLSLGQPNQEDLIEFLANGGPALTAVLQLLALDLSAFARTGLSASHEKPRLAFRWPDHTEEVV